MEYVMKKDEFIISDDQDKIDSNYVHSFLTASYWSPGVPLQTVKKAMEGSLSFGVYLSGHTETQVGYARMVTDKATFAWLADVFIDESYRGKGLGKWLVLSILAHPDVQGLRRILLATKDAHKLYEQAGFTALNNPERFMVYNPTGYKSK
ncbi:MAG: GNAT family N-acetyltransferase [Chitinophagaceae bacterium]|nr:GNAT family N-acetyltransferase [Chitinophagaceae bacterium]